jgi:O-antigen ligase
LKQISLSNLKFWFNQLDYLFFCLSIFTLTQSIKLSSKFLFIALALALLKSLYKRDFKWVKNQKQILIVNAIFFGYICLQGIFIDGFKVFANSFVRQYAPYIILILLPIFYSDNTKVNNIPKVLIAGMFFTFILIIGLSIFQMDFYNRDKVLEVFDLHHLYISLYILFAINHILHQISGQHHRISVVRSYLMLFVLSVFLILFKSKSAIVIGLFLFIYHFFSKFKLSKLAIVLLSSICLGTLVIFKNIFYNIYLDALDFRLRIWSAALEIISKKPLFGYGSSNEQILLNKQHFINGNYDFLDSELNTHNQLLTFILKFGLIGLSLIIISYIIPFRRMKTNLRKEYIGFLILFFLMAFIESLYNRHHGIVFCSVILYYYNIKSKTQV